MRRTKSVLVCRSVAASLLIGVAALPLAAGGAAVAQEAGQVSFNIPAQLLGSALATFGRQANMQVSVSAEAVRGLSASGVSGQLTAQEALARLLGGTGLSYRIDGRTVVVTDRVGAAHSAPASDGSLTLDTIDVSGGTGANADTPYTEPGSSSHISSEQIDRVLTGNPADVFKSTPGVISAGNRIGPSLDINIRGLQGESRVNVMIDGTRQSSGSYRGYRGGRSETYVDPDFLTSVDVTKGLSAGAGGVGVMGGVINMRTLDAEDVLTDGKSYGVRLKGGLGSNTIAPPPVNTTDFRDDSPFINGDAWNGNIAGAVTTENFDFVTAFSRRKSGNYFAGNNGKDTFYDDRSFIIYPDRRMSPYGKGDEVLNTSQDVASFLAKGTVRWGEGHQLKLGYTRYENDYGENYETELNFAISPNPNLVIPARQYELSNTVSNMVRSEYTYDAGNPLVNVSAHLWGTDLETQSSASYFNAGGDGDSGLVDVRTYGGDVANTSSFDTVLGAVTMENGAEFVYESARSDQIVRTYPWGTFYFSPNPNGDRTLASLFNRTKIEVTDYLFVSGGLRYDYCESEGKGLAAGKGEQSDSRLNPQIAVTVEPLDGLQLFGSYSNGWRPPSLREQTAFAEGVLAISDDLQPETSDSYEFGLNYLTSDLFLDGDHLRFKAVRFDNDYRNYIARGPRNVNYEYEWFNIDTARFKGFEFEGSYDTGGFFLEGAVTYYDDVKFCNDGACGFGVIGTDYGVMTIPPKYSATLTAGIRAFEERLTLGARGYFFGERIGGYKIAPGAVNPPVYYPETVVVDLFGSYKFSETTTADFSIENVGDKYYIDPLAAAIVPSPGRTVRVGFTTKF